MQAAEHAPPLTDHRTRQMLHVGCAMDSATCIRNGSPDCTPEFLAPRNNIPESIAELAH